VNVSEGLKENGKLLVNSKEQSKEVISNLKLNNIDTYTLDATKISLDILGNARALNTIMLGALVKTSEIVSLDSVLKAIEERFKGSILEKNLELVKKGYSGVMN
jgi:pyruvate ferredoxin oxidoreductase gamma subunit